MTCIESAIRDVFNEYICQTEQASFRFRVEKDPEGVEEMRRRITLLESLKREIIARITTKEE